MPRLATVDELATMLDLGGDHPARIQPDLLIQALNSAEQTVFQITGRQFWAEPALVDGEDTAPEVTKTISVRRRAYEEDAPACVAVRIPDLRSTSLVSLDGSTLVAGSEYTFDAYAGDEPYTALYLYQQVYGSAYVGSNTAALQITGRWGFLEVPWDVKEAVLQIASRRYHRRNAMFADQVDTGQGAFDFRGGVHPDIQGTLRRYRPLQVALI